MAHRFTYLSHVLNRPVPFIPRKIPGIIRTATSIDAARSSMIPDGFPNWLTGPMTWKGKDYNQTPKEYVCLLDQDHLSVIENALRHFKELGLGRGFISPKTFPLSARLAEQLRSVSSSIHNGRGFEVVRGLQPSRFNEEDLLIIYLGITSYVADKRYPRIRPIYDRTAIASADELISPPFQANTMSFHTDVNAGEILSLFTLSTGISGGDQHLVSSWKVYNQLVRELPDVLGTLTKDWRWQFPRDHDTPQICHQPIFSCVNGHVQLALAKTFLVGSEVYPLTADAPPLSEQQTRALHAMTRLCRENSFKLSQTPGDILFVNNLSILHARDSYKNGRQPETTRRLLNLMLRDTAMAWDQPKDSRTEFKGEIHLQPDEQVLWTIGEWEAHTYGNISHVAPGARVAASPQSHD